MPSEVRRLGLFAWFSVLLVSLLRRSMNCGGNSDLPRDALKFPTVRTDVHSCFWASWVTPWQFELSSWEFVVFSVSFRVPVRWLSPVRANHRPHQRERGFASYRNPCHMLYLELQQSVSAMFLCTAGSLLIHSFTTYLLLVQCAPCTVMGTGRTVRT